MADFKISQLKQLESLSGQELFPVANNGKNNSVSTSVLKQALVLSQILNGSGIEITSNLEGKLVINIDEQALEYIQYSYKEVKRLETDKVAWGYDEATKTAINILLPLLGKLLGTDGENNYNIAGVGVYNTDDGTRAIQVEIGTPGLILNLNSSERPTVEIAGEKKSVAFLTDIPGMTVYPVDFAILTSESPSSANISDAIGGWDSLVSAIKEGLLIVGISAGKFTTATHCEIMEEDKIIIAVNSESTAIKFRIVNTSGTLSCERVDTALQTSTDESLATTDKTVSGGINEVKAAADANTEAIGDVSEILERINNESI